MFDMVGSLVLGVGFVGCLSGLVTILAMLEPTKGPVPGPGTSPSAASPKTTPVD